MNRFFANKKENSLPYIIAEIGVNHEGSLKKAKKLIDEAVKGGADAVKFQTYKAETLAVKKSPAYWDTSKEKTKSQYKLFKKFDKFDKNHYLQLFNYCKKKNIDFSSTPFDERSVDFLNPFLKFYKIASADINNLPLLKKVASKKKPTIISTGASDIKEISFAVNFLKKNGCKEIIIMHCILNYPTKDINANLNMLFDLKKKFPKNIIGYSDHTLPDKNMTNLVTAYLFGAKVIEKHFTDNKRKKGNDHYHSMDFRDLKVFSDIRKKIHLIGGKSKKIPIKSENISRKNARRSIVLKKDIQRNEKINSSIIITKRPGTGITADNWYKIIGKKVKKNLKSDYILKWSDIY
ncbi:MAG: acetylneuraminic acid synthetase [Candidatus Pelagibacter sp.]|nr:acetylneuraminic acid synthetase [Candidatus Pelagibacter sp.]|tara:strand:+ start:1338 stop:2384 length:1047 start_codon:yes stop_codon:yes gene_type:complete